MSLHKCRPSTGDFSGRTTILFSVADRVGKLEECLAAIKGLNISLTRIERCKLPYPLVIACSEVRPNCYSHCSRPSRTPDWDYDFFVDFDAEDAAQVNGVVETLSKVTKNVKVAGAG